MEHEVDDSEQIGAHCREVCAVGDTRGGQVAMQRGKSPRRRARDRAFQLRDVHALHFAAPSFLRKNCGCFCYSPC